MGGWVDEGGMYVDWSRGGLWMDTEWMIGRLMDGWMDVWLSGVLP